MKKLHPIFNVVKLSTAPEDPIPGQRPQPLPLPIIIDGKEEWKVKEILDSRWYRRRFQFLVKWKGYRREHNSWKVVSNVSAPDLVVEYYCKYPIASRYICWMDFNTIFNPGVIASRCSNLRGRVSVRGPYQHHP